MKEVYDAVGSLPDKTNPQSSTLHYLYARIEDHILETWAASVERRAPGHLSLHFDGLRVGQFSTGVDVASLCQEAMNVIQEKTGFKVNIIEKQHYLFRELCRTPVESVEEPLHDTTLHQPGNCIPLAIARLFPDRLEDIRAVLREDTHKNKEASLRHSRCYASVLTPLRLNASAEHELNIDGHGLYLLHAEHDGNPHCLACSVGENDLVTIWDGIYTRQPCCFTSSWHSATRPWTQAPLLPLSFSDVYQTKKGLKMFQPRPAHCWVFTPELAIWVTSGRSACRTHASVKLQNLVQTTNVM